MTKKERIKQWLRELHWKVRRFSNVPDYPHIAPTARIGVNNIIGNPSNLYFEDYATLKRDSVIMNGRAKLIIKKWSGAAEEFMVVAGNHMSIVGMNVKQVTNEVKELYDNHSEYDKDIVVEEDVWIGARVTILSGVTVGRGSELGTACVVRKSVPPYAIVIGNPAKVVGFRFTPQEIVEHEKILYPENERLPLELLEKNYKKYFLDHIKEIKAFVGLICK